MKERPIIFSAPMVKAILDGTKTQTRRIVKIEPSSGYIRKGSRYWIREDPAAIAACPYGQPGDRLWVRETWAQYQTVNSIKRLDGRSYSEVSDGLAGYRADGCDTIKDFREHIMLGESDIEEVIINGDKWRPSIYMPRWASRITLEVTDVRIERLQDGGHVVHEADVNDLDLRPKRKPPVGDDQRVCVPRARDEIKQCGIEYAGA